MKCDCLNRTGQIIEEWTFPHTWLVQMWGVVKDILESCS